jgi:hypothetical protein
MRYLLYLPIDFLGNNKLHRNRISLEEVENEVSSSKEMINLEGW